MNTFSSTYGYNIENPTIRDFNMVCDLIEVVLVKKKTESLSLVYEDVLGNLITKYNEFLETDLIKSKQGNWIIRDPFANVKS
jgi:hypothetical protein